jgi:predicted HicB family RNase H-like nuclease
MGKSNTPNGARRGKAARGSKTLAATVAEALRYARSLRGKGLTWIEVSNALFGPGGKLTQLCPTEAERAALAKTSEYQEILRVIEDAREDGGDPSGTVGNWMSTASGQTTLRIPKSLHAALIAEAEAEGISLNQLCLTKLAVQLRAAVLSH